MDLVKFQASLDAHTQALTVHSAAIEKLIASASGVSSAGEAQPSTPKRGRPTNAEMAAKAAAAAQVAPTVAQTATTVQNTATVAQAAAVTQPTPATAAAATASNGPLTHLALKDKFIAFAKAKGRDAIVALLGEFGVTEFGKVKVEDLPLFRDRLDGKPQTPVDPTDVGNLLGM